MRPSRLRCAISLSLSAILLLTVLAPDFGWHLGGSQSMHTHTVDAEFLSASSSDDAPPVQTPPRTAMDALGMQWVIW